MKTKKVLYKMLILSAVFLLSNAAFAVDNCPPWDPFCGGPTLPSPPSTPPSLSLPFSPDGNGRYTIRWGASSGNVGQYELEEKWMGGINPSWRNRYRGTSRAKARSDMLGGGYFYRVRACNTAGCSNWRTSGKFEVLASPNLSISGATASAGQYKDYDDGDYQLNWFHPHNTKASLFQLSITTDQQSNITDTTGTSYQELDVSDQTHSYRGV